MPQVPHTINGVAVQFGPNVNNDVTAVMLAALEHTIIADVAPAHRLTRIYISSLRDQHVCPSRHVTGQGSDISRINNLLIGQHYGTNPAVRAIVDALQNRFESAASRRENFGPTINRRDGQPHNPPTHHNDHIHFSVNGPHNCPSPPPLKRLFEKIRRVVIRRAEVCVPDSGD